jgi:hypothetical protein
MVTHRAEPAKVDTRRDLMSLRGKHAMRTRLAIGAMAVTAAAVAGCSSGGGTHDTSAASSPTRSPEASRGPATGTAACDAINQTLNSIMTDAAGATVPANSKLTTQQAQQARQAKLALNLKDNAAAFRDDQSKAGVTSTLKQAEQTIAANVDRYYASYRTASSGDSGLKIIDALGQVKHECGTAPWQTAI